MVKSILPVSHRVHSKFYFGAVGVFILGFLIGMGGYFLRPPTVSVVMPVYNREKMVGDAIDSILSQSFQDFELVIVDDGSKDKTLDVVRAYAKKDSRIKVVVHEKNCGVGCARNTAQKHARGKYLAIMDSDDIMAEDRLVRQVAAMEDHPELTVLNGRILKYDEAEYKQKQKTGYTLTNNGAAFPVCMFFTNCFANVSSMIRRDFIVKNNIRYDETLAVGEDYDYWMQIIFAGGKLAGLKETLVWIRHTPGSALSSPKVVENTLEIKGRYFDKILGENDITKKWDYSLVEQCNIFGQFVKSKPWHTFLNAETVMNWYQKSCAPDVANKIYVQHPYWSDFLAFKEGNRLKRVGTDDMASYDIVDDVVTVKWDKYPLERFKLDKDGVYTFIDPNEKNFKIKTSWVGGFGYNIGRENVSSCR